MLLTDRKPAILAVDNLDDRREIVHLLDRLHPRKRIAFMRWCCRQAILPHGVGAHPQVNRKTLEFAEVACRDEEAAKRLTMDLFSDLYMLDVHYRFSLGAALAKLVEVAKKERRG
jgi:hypothetical protein